MTILETWYNAILDHAKANYANGWDFFVDSVDMELFVEDMRIYYVREYEDAFNLYKTWAYNRAISNPLQRSVR